MGFEHVLYFMMATCLGLIVLSIVDNTQIVKYMYYCGL